MKYLSLTLYYAGILLLGITAFFTIRWTVLSYEPVYSERVKQKMLSPEEVEKQGIPFEITNKYFQVEKEKTYVTAGVFPSIHTKTFIQKEIKIEKEDDGFK